MKNKMVIPNISGGAFIIARKIFESEIWAKPPHYLKIWIWLIGKANHQDRVVNDRIIKRGQCLVSIPETIESNIWMVGYRTERLTKKQAWSVYEFLRNRKMVETTKVTRGMIVTIRNYRFYQALSNYEYSTNVITNRKRKKLIGNTRNKNYKNERNFTYTDEEIKLAKRIANWGTSEARNPSYKTSEDYVQDILPHIQELGDEAVNKLFAKSEDNKQFWYKLRRLHDARKTGN
jgi:hypothetical protein